MSDRLRAAQQIALNLRTVLAREEIELLSMPSASTGKLGPLPSPITARMIAAERGARA